MSPWDEPGLYERFRDLVLNTNHTFAEVAQTLNAEFDLSLTRNACIGKAARAGLKKKHAVFSTGSKRGSETKASGRDRVTRTGQRRKTMIDLFGIVPDDLRDLPHDTSPCAKTILDLLDDRSQCRWPVTTPEGEMQLFCADLVTPDRPYCPRHCRAAYYVPFAVDDDDRNRRRSTFRKHLAPKLAIGTARFPDEEAA